MKLTTCAYYGFDKMNGTDDREAKWKSEREERGFDDSELWSLGDTIVHFALPRIKRFIEIEAQTNADWEEVKRDYEELIEGLELFVRKDGIRIWSKEEEAKVNKALNDFGPMLPAMWW